MHGRDIKVSCYPCPPPLARVLNEASAKNSNRNPFRTITYFVLTCILGNAARISEHARPRNPFLSPALALTLATPRPLAVRSMHWRPLSMPANTDETSTAPSGRSRSRFWNSSNCATKGPRRSASGRQSWNDSSLSAEEGLSD